MVMGDGRVGHKILGVDEPTRAYAADVGLRFVASASVSRPDPWGGTRQEHIQLYARH